MPSFVGFIRDISDIVTAETELSATEARYRSLIEQLPMMTYVTSCDVPPATLYVSPQSRAAAPTRPSRSGWPATARSSTRYDNPNDRDASWPSGRIRRPMPRARCATASAPRRSLGLGARRDRARARRRPPLSAGLHPGHHRAQAPRGAAPPVAEAGGDRPARRRRRARLQQPAHRDHRLQRSCSAARPRTPIRALRRTLDEIKQRRRARAASYAPAARLQPHAGRCSPQRARPRTRSSASMQTMLRRLIGEHDRARDRRSSRSCGRVRADPGQLEQVVLNLAVNARDAMPRGGPLTISDRRHARRGTRRSARSSSVVARHRHRHRTSRRAARICSSRSSRPRRRARARGSGSRRCTAIVRQSGGRIEVESSLGGGSTFCVRLPQVPAVSGRVAA